MNSSNLKNTLENLYANYHIDYLSTDPLEIVRRYEDPRDQEIAGFIAASLALGRADSIKKAVTALLKKMGTSPYRFVYDFDPDRNRNTFHGFVYRFYRERDVNLLIWWLHQMIREKGSIKAFFLKGYSEGDADIGPSLSRFIQSIRGLATEPFYSSLPPRGSGASHWLTDPANGSGCKRMNLFLRWMVRHDGLDLGLWPEVSPSQLIIPLDTHIARIGRRIRLTERATPDWKMAMEITKSLRKFDPEDPVKYDFALCRVGMLNACPDKANTATCSSCPLFQFCR